MNYFDKIRSLNNLQLCHFLRQIQGNLELVSIALDRACNPKLYCSDDNFCTGTPDKGETDAYYPTMSWFRCLCNDFDEQMAEIYKGDEEARDYLRGWSEKKGQGQENEN